MSRIPRIAILTSIAWIILIVLSATPWRYSPFWWAVFWIGGLPVVAGWIIRYWWRKKRSQQGQSI